MYWGAGFFSDLFTHFNDFWSQIRVVILITPKQEMQRTSEWFCGVNFLNSNLDLWFFTVFFFSIFWKEFLNRFPCPFIVHSSPRFLFEPNLFLASGFLFTWGILTLIFSFLILSDYVLEMVFSINSLSVLGLVFFYSKNSLNCTSCYIFLNSLYLLITFVVLHKSRLLRLTSDLPHSLSQLNGF